MGSASTVGAVGFDVLARGLGFTEGPVLFPKAIGGARTVVAAVMSIDRDDVVFVALDGTVSRVNVGGGPNGAAVGGDGTLFVAVNGGWTESGREVALPGGVQAIRTDGTVEWVTFDPISPNDLCFGPDGLLYVTDPSRPGRRGDGGRIWRVDAESGQTELLATVSWYPNGIAFAPDDALYVASTFDRHIVRYPCGPGGLGEPEIVARLDRGHPDGIAFDADGNLLVAAVSLDDRPGTLQLWSPEGEHLRTVEPGPDRLYTNLALGEDSTLIVTASDAGAVLVARGGWPTPGLALYPWRGGCFSGFDPLGP